MYHYAGNNPIRYVDPDGRWDVAFGNISFGKYDIFTPTKQVNTGNKFADFWLAGICGISNLCAVPFNYASNVLGLVDEGITWLDERWPSEFTLSGNGIRYDLDVLSTLYITNPELMCSLSLQIKHFFNKLLCSQREWAVIGPRSNYREFAESFGANYLKVTDEEWTIEKNLKYLEDVVKRKDNVIFSGQYDPLLLDPNSVLAREINYLESAGYKYIGNNIWIIE